MRKIIQNERHTHRISRFYTKFHTKKFDLSPDSGNVCEKSYTFSTCVGGVYALLICKKMAHSHLPTRATRLSFLYFMLFSIFSGRHSHGLLELSVKINNVLISDLFGNFINFLGGVFQ